jgi:hypothetical protein
VKLFRVFGFAADLLQIMSTLVVSWASDILDLRGV